MVAVPRPKKVALSSAVRMASYRQRMRAAGLRPVQLWVPDTRSPEFLARCEATAQAIAADDEDNDLEEWFALSLEGLPDYDWGEEGPPKP